MPLNPFAVAGNVRKSWPNALGSIAVNLIGEPQVVHCGPWFCVSRMCWPSGRSPEFPGKPSYESRLHRVARNDFVLYEVALRTLEPSMLKAHGTRTNARSSIMRDVCGDGTSMRFQGSAAGRSILLTFFRKLTVTARRITGIGRGEMRGLLEAGFPATVPKQGDLGERVRDEFPAPARRTYRYLAGSLWSSRRLVAEDAGGHFFAMPNCFSHLS